MGSRPPGCGEKRVDTPLIRVKSCLYILVFFVQAGLIENCQAVRVERR